MNSIPKEMRVCRAVPGRLRQDNGNLRLGHYKRKERGLEGGQREEKREERRKLVRKGEEM